MLKDENTDLGAHESINIGNPCLTEMIPYEAMNETKRDLVSSFQLHNIRKLVELPATA